MWMVCSQVSASAGQRVIGSAVGRAPKAWPPWAKMCISTGTLLALSARK